MPAFVLAILALCLHLTGNHLHHLRGMPARQRSDGGWQGRAMQELLELPSRQLAGRVEGLVTLLTIAAVTLASVALVPAGASVATQVFLLAGCVSIATALLAGLASLLPRWLVPDDHDPVRGALLLGTMLKLCAWPLRLLDRAANALLRHFGLDADDTHLYALDAFALDPVGRHLLQRVLRLGERNAASLMTPRTRMVWLDADADVAQSLTTIRATLHSRYPVFRRDAKDEREVLGILEVKRLAARSDGGGGLFDDLRPALFVPSSARAMDLLDEFRAARMPLALVVDEYGDIEGLVSVNDVLIAVIGRAAATPSQSRTQQIITNVDGSWLVDGSVGVDDLRELLSLDSLPNQDTHDFNTINGMVTAQFGRIPQPGEHFDWQDLRFQVMALDGARVARVHVGRLPADAAATA